MSRIRQHREGQPLHHPMPILPMEAPRVIYMRHVISGALLVAVFAVVMVVGSAVMP